MTEQKNLRVIFYKDKNDIWHAQCLEYDIAAQDANYNRLSSRFEAAFMAEAEISEEINGEVFVGIGPAPSVFHEMWPDVSKGISPDPMQIGDNGIKLEVGMAA